MTNRFGFTRALVFLALVLGCGAVMAGGPPPASTTDTQNVYWIDDGSDTDGDSFLTRTNGMILITLEAAGLVPGDVYTLWWFVFNDPTKCADHPLPCTIADIFNFDPETGPGGAIGHASGNIAKSDGTLEFGGRMVRNATAQDSGHQVLFGANGTDILLTASPHDAEVHLVVQSHGQGRGGKPLRKQLTYFVANCTPDCVDIQFTFHQP